MQLEARNVAYLLNHSVLSY